MRTGGSGCLFFFLIVFISAFLCAWKTGVLLWITFPRFQSRSGLIAHQPFTPLDDARRLVAVSVCLHGATGIEEKGNRLKEKTVVPVVQAGKVEILPK
jgi:hypothetical protein